MSPSSSFGDPAPHSPRSMIASNSPPLLDMGSESTRAPARYGDHTSDYGAIADDVGSTPYGWSPQHQKSLLDISAERYPYDGSASPLKHHRSNSEPASSDSSDAEFCHDQGDDPGSPIVTAARLENRKFTSTSESQPLTSEYESGHGNIFRPQSESSIIDAAFGVFPPALDTLDDVHHSGPADQSEDTVPLLRGPSTAVPGYYRTPDRRVSGRRPIQEKLDHILATQVRRSSRKSKSFHRRQAKRPVSYRSPVNGSQVFVEPPSRFPIPSILKFPFRRRSQFRDAGKPTKARGLKWLGLTLQQKLRIWQDLRGLAVLDFSLHKSPPTPGSEYTSYMFNLHIFRSNRSADRVTTEGRSKQIQPRPLVAPPNAVVGLFRLNVVIPLLLLRATASLVSGIQWLLASPPLSVALGYLEPVKSLIANIFSLILEIFGLAQAEVGLS